MWRQEIFLTSLKESSYDEKQRWIRDMVLLGESKEVVINKKDILKFKEQVCVPRVDN